MKLIKQQYDYDCGPACLRMLYKHFNPGPWANIPYKKIIKMANCTKDGTEFKDFNRALTLLGMKRKRVTEDWFKNVLLDPRPYVTLIKDPEVPYEDHYIILRRMYNMRLFAVFDPYYGHTLQNQKDLFPKIRKFNKKPWIWGIEPM